MGLTQRLGTIPLAIQTDSSNNVGIGTSTIGGKLDVRAAATSAFSYYFRNAAGGYGGGVYNTGSNNTQLYLATSAGTENILLNSSGASYFNGGNVGIANTNPSYKLDIHNGSDFDIRLRDTSLGGTVGILFETANDFSGTSQAYIKGIGAGNSGVSQLIFGTAGASGDTSATERMRITSSGSLLIGTTSTAVGGILSLNGDLKFGGTAGGNYSITNYQGGFLAFGTDNTERMRITSGGYIYLGDGYSSTNHRINLATGQGNRVLVVSGYNGSNNDTAIFYASSGSNPNAAATSLGVTTNSSTGRSISAGGGIYASGNDYAEYMIKSIEDNIEKGDIVGVNDNGLLTNIFADAKSFVVKSTNPSYIGGDVWGNETAIGKKPERTTEQTEEEFESILAEFELKLEEARAKVDRIAFSGQVPCNVLGANVGDYIIPINDNGKITGQAVTNPTFEQYQISVGKVWKIMEDGRAWIAVKIG